MTHDAILHPGDQVRNWLVLRRGRRSFLDCRCTICGHERTVQTGTLLRDPVLCQGCKEQIANRPLPKQNYIALRRNKKTMASRFNKLMDREEAGIELTQLERAFCELYILRGVLSVQRTIRDPGHHKRKNPPLLAIPPTEV